MQIEVDLPPTLLMSYLKKAQEAHERGDRQSAIKNYTRVLIIDPDCVAALNNIAMMLAEDRKWTAAVACTHRAAAQCDDTALPWANHAAVLIGSEAYEEAAIIFERLVRSHPNEPRFWQDLGLAYTPTEPHRALDCLKRSVELAPSNPNFLHNLGLQQLAARDWDVGFANWRRSGLDTITDPNFTVYPEWRGEPLGGKTIIVYHEQGMGDTIQFCRFLKLIEAERVVLAVPAPLVRLMDAAGVADEVVDFADPVPASVDYQCPLMFAWAYRSISSALAEIECPYLKAPPRGPRVHRGENTALMVGVCWAGNPVYGTDKLRSMPVEELLPLASMPGVQLISLQKGPRAGDVNECGADLLIRDLSGQIGDMADVAFVIDKLDLIVSVDTAALHLAGALGKPAIAMLPYNRCWRWSRGTDETPFYPTMRLVTQPSPGDWKSVVGRVRERIVEMVGDWRTPLEPQTDYELLNVPGRAI